MPALPLARRALRALRLSAAALAVGLGALALTAAPADAQYFGRNKVRYDDFDFRILQTEHFDIYYYPAEEQAARDVGRMSERWYARLSRVLGHEFDERKSVILYADDADFRQTNITDIGEGTQGVTDALRQRNVLAVRGTYEETHHVLGHEMVHQFQYDIAERGGTSQNLFRMPLYLIEGLAEYLTVGRDDALTSMVMRDAVLRDEFPRLSRLGNDSRYNEYQYGQPFWAYVGGTYGDEAAVRLFKLALEIPIDSAIVSVTGLQGDSLGARWEDALRQQYLPLVGDREVPFQVAEDLAKKRDGVFPDTLRRTTARRLLARDLDSGEVNIAPSVSPDGRYVAYFSERDLFGIDLYLADARTGEVIRKLAEAGSDSHNDALSFLESSGSWSPDGRRFAYVVFADGENEIEILDVERRDVERRIAVRDVGAIRDPAWSPDGAQIVFSGMKGGISDLYVVDVAAGTVRQLTNDRHADLQPQWSPDGRQIAFATDRGPGTDFDRLTFAPLRLAYFDVATSEVEPLVLFADAKHINPYFSPDGRSLYFISDRDGYNNVYRLERASGALFQVTNVATGVSGISDYSPAISVARQTGELVFSVYESNRYTVYALDGERVAGAPVAPETPGVEAAGILPPADYVQRSVVEGYLADAGTGLPATRAFPERGYRPGLRLDYVSQPQVGIGYDSYAGSGFGLAGGISFLFSDQLSDQVLGVAVSAQGTLQDIGGQALYLNRGNRLNWGGLVGHVPYLQLRVGRDLDDPQYLTRYYFRTFVTQASGLAQYPLSQTRRFEAEGGYRRIGTDLEYDDLVDVDGDGDPDALDRRELSGEEFEALTGRSADALHLFDAGTAFVGDYSQFGFTSPIRGGRYRFGVDATAGSIALGTLTADYRRYFFLRPPSFPTRLPVTLALRGLHVGRYGPDAGDARLIPYQAGFGPFVRGYSYSSFTRDDAGLLELNELVDQLYGSRLGVLNAELRLPFFGIPRLGLVSFPYLPTELVLFADAGAAWGATEYFGDPVGQSFSDLVEDPLDNVLFSIGASARVNILGAIILEPYYALPLSRGDRAGVFGLNLTPGW